MRDNRRFLTREDDGRLTPRTLPRPLTVKQRYLFKVIKERIDYGADIPGATVMGRLAKMTEAAVISALKGLARKGYIIMNGDRTTGVKLTGKVMRDED